jgi:hypothetical protein
MTTLLISVNRHVLQSNHTNGRNDPPFEVRTSKTGADPETVRSAEYTGRIRLVYNPDSPLISGAECWIEVDLLDE